MRPPWVRNYCVGYGYTIVVIPMKIMKNITSFLLSIFLLAIVHPKDAFVEFYVLKDTSYWEGYLFKINVRNNQGNEYIIVRKVVAQPTYDGPPGKTVIIVTKNGKTVFHEEIPGQFQLFGFSSDQDEIYAFHNGQQGAEFRILNIVLFSQKHPKGKAIGPKGGFQYGSSSPDGCYCLLLDSCLFAVNLINGKWEKLQTEYEFNNTEADPIREGKYGGTSVGGSVNLSGDFLEMIWQNTRSGILIIKNLKYEIIKEIPINIKNKG
jgi:hypothetical protein